MTTPYAKRVRELEAEGMTTSDAQGAADVEFAQRYAMTMLTALRRIEREANRPESNGAQLTPEAMLTAIGKYAKRAVDIATGEA